MLHVLRRKALRPGHAEAAVSPTTRRVGGAATELHLRSPVISFLKQTHKHTCGWRVSGVVLV